MKFPAWKHLFKWNPGCLNKEYDSIFKHIHQNITTIQEIKKYPALIDDKETIAYWEEHEHNKVQVLNFALFQVERERGLFG